MWGTAHKNNGPLASAKGLFLSQSSTPPPCGAPLPNQGMVFTLALAFTQTSQPHQLGRGGGGDPPSEMWGTRFHQRPPLPTAVGFCNGLTPVQGSRPLSSPTAERGRPHSNTKAQTQEVKQAQVTTTPHVCGTHFTLKQ